MPKLLSEQALNEVRYQSIADYMRRVDELEHIEDKLAFTTRYLLSYGDHERDVPLAEAIHIAKLKIADASAELRVKTIMAPDEAVDPNASDEQDAANREFMVDPVGYLIRQAQELSVAEANKPEGQANQEKIDELQIAAMIMLNGANAGLSAEVSELEIEPTTRDVEARLREKFGGVKQLKDAYAATKPSLLSKAFGTSSVAYHNLDQAYNAFFNPDHANYGNMNALDKAATEYLQHLVPTWNPKNGPLSKSSVLRTLDGTQKARAALCFNILKATSEQRESEHVYETIVSANIQIRANREAEQAGANIENENFQQGLLDEINEEQASADYHANFEDVPENVEEAEDDYPPIAQ